MAAADVSAAKAPGPSRPPAQDEMTPEDAQKSEELEQMVASLVTLASEAGSDSDSWRPILSNMCDQIRSASGTMSAVPRVLRFLSQHRPALAALHAILPDSAARCELADLVSALSALFEDPNCEALRFKLMGTPEVVPWGQEYMRRLSTEIPAAYREMLTRGDAADPSALLQLVDPIVAHNLSHHAEHEACDLLLEIDRLPTVLPLVDKANVERVSIYLTACARYVASAEAERAVLEIVIECWCRFDQFARAMQLALRLRDTAAVRGVVACAIGRHGILSPEVAQLGFMTSHASLARLWPADLFASVESNAAPMMAASGRWQAAFLKHLQTDLHVASSKEPEDVYKSHLSDHGASSGGVGLSGATPAVFKSNKAAAAAAIVSGLLNAGSGLGPDPSRFTAHPALTRGRETATLLATASVGLIHLWDPERAAAALQPALASSDPNAIAGAALGIGMSAANVVDAAVTNLITQLLVPLLMSPHAVVVGNAALGIGIGHVNAHREDVLSVLQVGLEAARQGMADAAGSATEWYDAAALVSLGMALLFVGSADEAVAASLVEVEAWKADQTATKLVQLARGLLYLATGREGVAHLKEAVAAVAAKDGDGELPALIELCALSMSGSPLDIQHWLSCCMGGAPAAAPAPSAAEATSATTPNATANALPDPTTSAERQALAALGVGFVAMAEPIGAEMAARMCKHLLRYGEPSVRQAVPLTLALLHLGQPHFIAMDTLSKLSHDHNPGVAITAAIALGLMGAGSNHSRIAHLFRQLVNYHYKDAASLYAVRIAQGLLHLGKGTLSLRVSALDRDVPNLATLAGLTVFAVAALDWSTILLQRMPQLVFALATAVRPHCLITVDEGLQPCAVPVRVGTAVDLVGQAGKPRTITGFQTHNSPVLLVPTDRAEMVNEADERRACTPILEGVVILKNAPQGGGGRA